MYIKPKFTVENNKLILSLIYGDDKCNVICKSTEVNLDIPANSGDIHLTNVIQNTNSSIITLVMSNGINYPINLINFLPNFINLNVNNELKIVNGKFSVIADETVNDIFNIPLFKAFTL